MRNEAVAPILESDSAVASLLRRLPDSSPRRRLCTFFVGVSGTPHHQPGDLRAAEAVSKLGIRLQIVLAEPLDSPLLVRCCIEAGFGFGVENATRGDCAG